MSSEEDEWEDPLDPDEERARLNRFLKPFDMMPDVRSKIEAQFWRRKGLYRAIVRNISAYDRVVANFTYADAHQGNVVIELWGRKRHSKSTVARWICRLRMKLRTGSDEGWELKVIYRHAYSGTTIALQTLAQEIRATVPTNEAMLKLLVGYQLVQDESQEEHEKDSVKAKHDLWNIAATCAVSGIDMYFLSTKRRGISPDFSLWVVGIDKARGLNLSFYYDNEGRCHGHLITKNIPETEKYKVGKDDIVAETLLHGGRAEAEVKTLSSANGASPVPVPAAPPIRTESMTDTEFLRSLVEHTLAEGFRSRRIRDWKRNAKYASLYLVPETPFLSYPNTISLYAMEIKKDQLMNIVNASKEFLSGTTLGDIGEVYAFETLRRLLPPSRRESLQRHGGVGAPDLTDGSVSLNVKLLLIEDDGLALDATPESQSPPGGGPFGNKFGIVVRARACEVRVIPLVQDALTFSMSAKGSVGGFQWLAGYLATAGGAGTSSTSTSVLAS